MAEIQRVSQEHLTRADTYMKLRQWDYAIEELEKGIPLNPFSLDTISCLGEAYLGRWCLKHKRADGVNLQTAARKCLQIQPDSPIAMSLLSRFYRYSKWRRSSQLIFGAISLGLIGGVVLAATQDSLRSLIVSHTPIGTLIGYKDNIDTERERLLSTDNRQAELNRQIESFKTQQTAMQAEIESLKTKQSSLQAEIESLKTEHSDPTSNESDNQATPDNLPSPEAKQLQ
ncbi:hypothetical protein [Chamaesiphon minutus]|nr:hypothetical protein [Chamaesiphon minutus]